MKQKNSNNNNIFLGPQLSVSLPHSEPQPVPASPRNPLIPLGRSLDLLWALRGQLTLWPGPIPMCTYPRSPQLLKLDQPSIVGTLIIYSDIPEIQVLPSQLQGFNPLLLWLHGKISIPLLWSHHPWAQLCFWHHLCMWATLRHLFPAWVRGDESSGWLEHTYSGRREGWICQPLMGCAGSACSSRDLQEVATALGMPCILLGNLV